MHGLCCSTSDVRGNLLPEKAYCEDIATLSRRSGKIMLAGWLIIATFPMCATCSLEPAFKVPALWPQRRRRRTSFMVTLPQHMRISDTCCIC